MPFQIPSEEGLKLQGSPGSGAAYICLAQKPVCFYVCMLYLNSGAITCFDQHPHKTKATTKELRMQWQETTESQSLIQCSENL